MATVESVSLEVVDHCHVDVSNINGDEIDVTDLRRNRGIDLVWFILELVAIYRSMDAGLFGNSA